MVVGPAVDMAAVVVETAGNSDNAEVEAAGNFDTVVVVEAVGTDGAAGNLYYLVDAAVVE